MSLITALLVFMHVYNECFPLVTKKINTFRANSKPWFIRGLNKSVKKLKLYSIWLHSRSNSDLLKYKYIKIN